MTKRLDAAKGASDRPALEIEITPQMIEVGVKVLDDWLDYWPREAVVKEVIRQILLRQ